MSKSAFFEGVGHFECNFRRKGASPTNHCWRQKTRVIALSSGNKISAMHCLVLSQSTRVTDGRTDRHNYDFQDRTSIAASRGKNRANVHRVITMHARPRQTDGRRDIMAITHLFVLMNTSRAKNGCAKFKTSYFTQGVDMWSKLRVRSRDVIKTMSPKTKAKTKTKTTITINVQELIRR